MPEDFISFLYSVAMDGLVDWQIYEAAYHLFAVSYSDIELAVSKQGLFPKRYEAQHQLFQFEGQLRLFQALEVRVILRDILSIGQWFSLDLKNMDVEHIDFMEQ